MHSAPSRDQQPPALDFNKMTKLQKLAALLIMLGRENAANILKSFDEKEVESISSEMANLQLITPDVQEQVLDEFAEVAVLASASAHGGIEFVQAILQAALGTIKATDIINRVSPSRTAVGTIQQVVNMDPRQVFNLLRNEHPQMIAVVASCMAPEKAAHLISSLSPELRADVVERLATSSSTTVDVMETLGRVLSQRLGGRAPQALNQTGGLKRAANLLNAMDKNASKALLAALGERKPELAQNIRQKMFSFENLAFLDDRTLQRLMREVDLRQLSIAIKTASEALRNALLNNISKRAAESVRDEMAFMGPIKLRDVEAAQNAIIDILRRLEDSGEIELENLQTETIAA